MRLLGSLFNRRPVPRPEPRDAIDDKLNAVLIPLRNRVCDFKDVTAMSWDGPPLRSASRDGNPTGVRFNTRGFRVGRTLIAP